MLSRNQRRQRLFPFATYRYCDMAIELPYREWTFGDLERLRQEVAAGRADALLCWRLELASKRWKAVMTYRSARAQRYHQLLQQFGPPVHPAARIGQIGGRSYGFPI